MLPPKVTWTSPIASGSTDETPVTIELWTFFTPGDPTSKQLEHVLGMFHEQYPWITVEPKGGINANKILASINAGNSRRGAANIVSTEASRRPGS